MKTLKNEFKNAMIEEFILSNEEMINVRGGENDPLPVPIQPPIKI